MKHYLEIAIILSGYAKKYDLGLSYRGYFLVMNVKFAYIFLARQNRQMVTNSLTDTATDVINPHIYFTLVDLYWVISRLGIWKLPISS
jgi:hypothetical protein